MSVFSERLINARKQKGYTQRQLADLLNSSPTRVNYWEKGKREPTVDMIKQLSCILNVKADYLLGLIDNPTPISATENYTDKEKKIIQAYRKDSNVQRVVDNVYSMYEIIDISPREEHIRTEVENKIMPPFENKVNIK